MTKEYRYPKNITEMQKCVDTAIVWLENASGRLRKLVALEAPDRIIANERRLFRENIATAERVSGTVLGLTEEALDIIAKAKAELESLDTDEKVYQYRVDIAKTEPVRKRAQAYRDACRNGTLESFKEKENDAFIDMVKTLGGVK